MPNKTGGTLGECALELRISLRGTHLYDSFSFAVPSNYANGTLADLIGFVFPEDVEAFQKIYESLDIRANPDLPEIYIALLEIIETWRSGECSLYFSTGSGLELQPSKPIRKYMKALETASSGGRVLDLVIEQVFDVLAHFRERGGDKSALLQWMRGMTLLYFIDKHEFQLRHDTQDEAARLVLSIAEDLRSKNILALSEAAGPFEITDEGRRTLGEMIAETESYVDQYDLFKDVTYDLDAQMVEFDNGYGADYRVQVYDAEGLDIYRTVFLLRMYDGTLDQFSGNWQEGILGDDLFNEILRPVLDRERIDGEILDWIIENGFAHNEEQLEADRERESQREIVRRVRPE